jgi:hypothetical protein
MLSYSEAGRPQGLLTGKKVYLVTAAGGVFSQSEWAALDFQTGYLRHLLGFIGLTDVESFAWKALCLGLTRPRPPSQPLRPRCRRSLKGPPEVEPEAG